MATERQRTKEAIARSRAVDQSTTSELVDLSQKGTLPHIWNWQTPGTIRYVDGVIGIGYLTGGKAGPPRSDRPFLHRFVGLADKKDSAIADFAAAYGPLCPFRDRTAGRVAEVNKFHGKVPTEIEPTEIQPYGDGAKFDHRPLSELRGSYYVAWNEGLAEWRSVARLLGQCVQLHVATVHNTGKRREQEIQRELGEIRG